MKLAIMQPYFFPYLGYFSLIKHTDQFILFDTIQFIRHGWIERNRILKQNDGWLYISVPLIKNGRETLIKDALIDNKQNWKEKILAQLQPYKKIAPFYSKVKKLLNDLFSNEFYDIVELDKSALELVCGYLEINTSIKVLSKMNLEIIRPNAPDEWALNICKKMGNVGEYWNPPGGQSFFDRAKYEKEGLMLRFQKLHLQTYCQKRKLFESSLSIIDVLMFNDIAKINEMLDDYELI